MTCENGAECLPSTELPNGVECNLGTLAADGGTREPSAEDVGVDLLKKGLGDLLGR